MRPTTVDLARRRCLAAALGLGALAAAGSTGCTPEQPLRVSYHPWSGYEPLRLYADVAPHAMANLQLIEATDAETQLQLLRLGQVEAALLPLDEVILIQAQGLSLTIVSVLDVSSGADRLLARGPCRDAAAWRGARVAVERLGPGRILLQAWCEHIGLEPDALRRLPYSPPNQLEAWQRREFDLAVTYQPYAERLLREGAFPCFDSSALGDILLDVLVVRNAVLDLHEATIKRLVHAHFLGLEWMNDNTTDARYRLARRFALPPEEAFTPFMGLVFPSIAEQRLWLERDLPRAVDALAGLLRRAALLPSSAATPTLRTSLRFLPSPSA